jgi:hypothetical protein
MYLLDLVSAGGCPRLVRVFRDYNRPILTPSCSDDCAEVRRKIRLLEKTPGWKVGLFNPRFRRPLNIFVLRLHNG